LQFVQICGACIPILWLLIVVSSPARGVFISSWRTERSRGQVR